MEAWNCQGCLPALVTSSYQPGLVPDFLLATRILLFSCQFVYNNHIVIVQFSDFSKNIFKCCGLLWDMCILGGGGIFIVNFYIVQFSDFSK